MHNESVENRRAKNVRFSAHPLARMRKKRMKNGSKNRIDEERVCVDSLAYNLIHHHGCSDVKVYP
jgi:hypothetical protein